MRLINWGMHHDRCNIPLSVMSTQKKYAVQVY